MNHISIEMTLEETIQELKKTIIIIRRTQMLKLVIEVKF